MSDKKRIEETEKMSEFIGNRNLMNDLRKYQTLKFRSCKMSSPDTATIILWISKAVTRSTYHSCDNVQGLWQKIK